MPASKGSAAIQRGQGIEECGFDERIDIEIVADSDETTPDGADWVIFTRGTPELLPMRTPVSDPLCTPIIARGGLEDSAPGPRREVCSG